MGPATPSSDASLLGGCCCIARGRKATAAPAGRIPAVTPLPTMVLLLLLLLLLATTGRAAGLSADGHASGEAHASGGLQGSHAAGAQITGKPCHSGLPACSRPSRPLSVFVSPHTTNCLARLNSSLSAVAAPRPAEDVRITGWKQAPHCRAWPRMDS
jgi:hypothetical protein